MTPAQIAEARRYHDLALAALAVRLEVTMEEVRAAVFEPRPETAAQTVPVSMPVLSPEVTPGAVESATAGPVKEPQTDSKRTPLQTRVVACHEAHPDWTARQIGDDLGVDQKHVSTVGRRLGLPIRKLTSEELIEARRSGGKKGGTALKAMCEQAAAPDPVPSPAPEREAPEPEPFVPDAPRKIVPPKGTMFRLTDGNGNYLHWSAETMVKGTRNSWMGTKAQLAGCRRVYPLAHDLIERAVEKA